MYGCRCSEAASLRSAAIAEACSLLAVDCNNLAACDLESASENDMREVVFDFASRNSKDAKMAMKMLDLLSRRDKAALLAATQPDAPVAAAPNRYAWSLMVEWCAYIVAALFDIAWHPRAVLCAVMCAVAVLARRKLQR